MLVIIISAVKRIGIGKDLSLGILKGGVQLFAIAAFLTFLFSYSLWYLLIWLLLGTMVLMGGHTSAKRATGMPKAYQITTPSILFGATVAMVVLAVTRAMPLKPQFIIPLAGMAFGNSMAICSLSLDRLLREARLNSQVIETSLSLGATSKQAIEPLSRVVVRAALIPTIDRLKTLGIIFIPGAMSGLIIAGTDPLLAAEYQIIVYLMIVASGLLTAISVSYLARKRLFTQAEQLEEWVYENP